jgi:hypothetical protein
MAQLTHQVFVTVQDKAGLKSTAIVHIPIATTPQDALDFADLLINEIDPLILGGIVSAGVTLAADIAGHGTIGSTANVQERGEFTFLTANNFVHSVGLPTFDEDLVVASSRSIDLTQEDVEDFVDAMLIGLAVPSTELITPVDSRGEDLASLTSALERFRRR